MTVLAESERRTTAKIGFKRFMIWTCIAGVLMVVAALVYLSAGEDPLSGHMIVATAAGVFLSVLLGAGLMAIGFYSSNSGHDDSAAGCTSIQKPPVRQMVADLDPNSRS